MHSYIQKEFVCLENNSTENSKGEEINFLEILKSCKNYDSENHLFIENKEFITRNLANNRDSFMKEICSSKYSNLIKYLKDNKNENSADINKEEKYFITSNNEISLNEKEENPFLDQTMSEIQFPTHKSLSNSNKTTKHVVFKRIIPPLTKTNNLPRFQKFLSSENFNKSENLQLPEAKKKRKYVKSKDIKISDQKYSCKICGKIYISYPAFYTHKRNRHNIISITNRHEFFKTKINEGASVKYNYNSIGYGKIINFSFSNFLLTKMKMILEKIYKYENSIFFINKEYNLNSHIFIEYLEKYKLIFSNKIFIPPAQLNLSIDEILVVYFILFSKVINDNTLIEIAALFIILFREYLNIYGFDFFKNFKKFGLFEEIKSALLFTQNPFIHYIPDLAEEFVYIFLQIPEVTLIVGDLEKLESLCKNLCNWLFVNELSNLKLTNLEKKLKGNFDFSFE